MRIAVLTAAVCLSIVGAAAAEDASAAIRGRTSIPAQGLVSALYTLAEDRKLYLIFAAHDLKNLSTSGATGELTAGEALTQLLSGTGLTYRFLDENTVSILPIGAASPPTSSTYGTGTAEEMRLAQAQTGNGVDSGGASSSSSRGSPASDDLASVVVTGSRIVGAAPSSPVTSVQREDFRSQGAKSMQDILRDIPLNFSGDYSAEATGAGQGGGITNNAYNRARASAPNIHGLGAAATLSLLNGRRLPTASNGYSVDLTMIPLLALSRVDVLADGASPIYGADAIAGVVNLVTRKNEDTLESVIRYGAPTESGYGQLQIGQSFGTQWSRGSVFLAYQYDDQDALRAYQRERTSNLRFNTHVFPEQEQHGFYANLQQQVTDSVNLGFEGLYSTRDYSGSYDYVGGSLYLFENESDQYLAALTADVALPADWHLSSYVQVAGAKNIPLIARSVAGTPTTLVDESFKGHETTIGASFSGELFEMGSIGVRSAIGAEYREENRSMLGTGDGITNFDATREVTSLFAEVQIPFTSTFEASAALRYDDYSDFGDTTNPKLGLVWRPIDGLRLRGTFSTSFRALSLKDRYGQVSAGIYRFVQDAQSPMGQALALFVNGNPASTVRPEESDNFTFGVDFSPAALPGLSMAATFFSVKYDGRIVAPNQAVTDILNADLPDSRPFMTRNPDVAMLEEILSQVSAVGSFTGQPHTPDQVAIFIDNRFVNLSSSEVRGVDLDFTYALKTSGPSWTFYSRSTFGIDYKTAATPSLPDVDRIGNVYYPAKFRTRTGATLQQGILHAGLALNYTDRFIDDRFTPVDPISSWFTADLNIGIDTGATGGAFRDMSLELVARNIFDKDPPAVLPTPVAPTDLPLYDSANASIIGRMLSLQVSKRW